VLAPPGSEGWLSFGTRSKIKPSEITRFRKPFSLIKLLRIAESKLPAWIADSLQLYFTDAYLLGEGFRFAPCC
jgi:hypothetical protein